MTSILGLLYIKTLETGPSLIELIKVMPELGWTMGMAIADYDSDGDRDLYVTRWGKDVMLNNNGEGNFKETTESWIRIGSMGYWSNVCRL